MYPTNLLQETGSSNECFKANRVGSTWKDSSAREELETISSIGPGPYVENPPCRGLLSAWLSFARKKSKEGCVKSRHVESEAYGIPKS